MADNTPAVSNGGGTNGSLFRFNFGRFSDTFQNLLAGLGVTGRDKVMSHEPILDLLSDPFQLEALYRSNWLAEKIVRIPAFDATRAWRQWDADDEQIAALEKAEAAFGLQRKVLAALIKARLYGGAAMVIGIKNQNFEKELDIDTVKKGDLAFVHVIEKWMIQAGPVVRDIMSPWFGEPEYYMRSNTPIIGTGEAGGVEKLKTFGWGHYAGGEPIYMHPSRVVRLVGIDFPNMETAPDAWGDSVLQPLWEALRQAGMVTSSLASMVGDAKVDVYKIPGLTGTLSTTDGTNKLVSYLSNANVAKSAINSLVVDKEIDWERIETSFRQVPEVMHAFLLTVAAAADIPATRLLGREPAGMNATGDSDTRNYYDRIHADQKVRLTPVLNRLDEVLIRHTFGTRPKEIKYDWNSLWQLTDQEKADIAFKKAQAYAIDVNTALLPPEALQKGRENQLIEDDFYPGLDQALEDVEERQKELEEQYGVGEGPDEGLQPGTQPPKAGELGGSGGGKPGGGQPGGGGGKPNGGGKTGGGKGGFGSSNDSWRDDGEQSALGFTVPYRKRRKSDESDDQDFDDAIDWNAARDAGWEEYKHPRGGAKNPGQFTSGGGGGKPQGAQAAGFRRGDRVQVASGEHAGATGIVHTTVIRQGGTMHYVRFDKPSNGKPGAPFAPEQLGAATARAAPVKSAQQQLRERLTGHPGHGYSPEAILRNGVIYTSNVYDATRALYENRHVVLDQPRQVSTLLQHLGQVSQRMMELKKDAPNFDLCNVSVKGTNLFCAESKGIPRAKMPQLDDDRLKAFRKSLKAEGIKIEKTTEDSDHLRATQNQLIGAKVARTAEKIEQNPNKARRRIMVSRDNYILDGHHTWAAIIGIDAKNNRLGDHKMRISRVDLDIISLLKKAEKFSGPHQSADSLVKILDDDENPFDDEDPFDDE